MIFIETGRLLLRNVSTADAEEMYDYRNHELCARYQRGQTKDREGIAELLEKRSGDVLSMESPCLIGVEQKGTGQLAGEIVVMPNDGTISLGYTFSYKYHRRGFTFEALGALTEFLLEKYPQWDFICFTDPKMRPASAS